MAEKGKPFNSILAEYEGEIIKLRSKRPPMPFSKIVEYLQKEHGIEVRRQTVYQYLKVRAKGYKPCKLVEAIIKNADTQATPEVLPVTAAPKQTVLGTSEAQKPTIAENRKSETAPTPKEFSMKWSDNYNLNRVSEEEAANALKIIEERKKK